jgi:PEGA domain
MRKLLGQIKLAKLVSHLVLVGVVCCALMPTSTGVRAQSSNGSLKVTSFPSGAEVWVNGQPTGKITPMNISLPVGDHTVMVRIPPVPGSGWNPDTRTVNVVAGNNDLSVTLLPMLTTGPQGPAGPPGLPKARKVIAERQARRDQPELRLFLSVGQMPSTRRATSASHNITE